MNNTNVTLEMIQNDQVPYMTGTMRGFDYDTVTEWYYSGKVVTRKIPATLFRPWGPILPYV